MQESEECHLICLEIFLEEEYIKCQFKTAQAIQKCDKGFSFISTDLLLIHFSGSITGVGYDIYFRYSDNC